MKESTNILTTYPEHVDTNSAFALKIFLQFKEHKKVDSFLILCTVLLTSLLLFRPDDFIKKNAPTPESGAHASEWRAWAKVLPNAALVSSFIDEISIVMTTSFFIPITWGAGVVAVVLAPVELAPLQVWDEDDKIDYGKWWIVAIIT